jgi:hypothetical protein
MGKKTNISAALKNKRRYVSGRRRNPKNKPLTAHDCEMLRR